MDDTREAAIRDAKLGHEDEDPATLAAIDEGIADSKAGRTIFLEDVRKKVRPWTTVSPSRNER
jgi:predicted transcriptional regulator